MSPHRSASFVLPARPVLFPDELLSSWFVRLARANALKVQELLTLISGTRRSLMGRDLDALIDPSFADTLARLSGVPATVLSAKTFDAQRTDLTAIEQPKSGTRRWILPMASRDRRPTGAWLQLCVACLRDDPTPYIRQRWRYAFVTTCAVHGTVLITSCPHCGAPFDFTAHDIGIPRAERIVSVSECSGCRRDVRGASLVPEKASREVIRYEQALCAALQRGWTRARGAGWIYSNQALDAIHRLLRLLRSSKGLRRLALESTSPSQVFRDEIIVPAGRFESWPVEARHFAMSWISSTFRGWPDQFVDSCLRLGVLSYAILGHRGQVPYWFERVVRDHLYRPWYAPTAEEAESARQAIARAGQPDTHSNLRRWLGRYYQDKPYMQRLERPSPSPRQLELFEAEAT